MRAMTAGLVMSVMLTAGCTAGGGGLFSSGKAPGSPAIGTLSPDLPTGPLPESGIQVVDQIPVDELKTNRPAKFKDGSICEDVPRAALKELRLKPSTVEWASVCQYIDSNGVYINLGRIPTTMRENAEYHLKSAAGDTTDELTHLAWLRIDGHYAFERILKSDRGQGCTIYADYGSPEPLYAMIYKEKVKETKASVKDLCPIARNAVQVTLKHLV